MAPRSRALLSTLPAGRQGYRAGLFPKTTLVFLLTNPFLNMNNNTHEIIIFANGCFWCTEAVFESLKGVLSVMPGYTGGSTGSLQAAPTYEQVCTGSTGHAEAIKIEYDPSKIKFSDLLTVFFATHDPTTLNRQGADVGTQYRSGIFYSNDEQKQESLAFIKKLNEEGPRVVTEVTPLADFYPAEEYHRKYYQNNSDAPYCQVMISPKLKKLNERFSQLLKESE